MSNAHIHRRMARKKAKKDGGLNLVSLMDIFTILVFFLLVNSSSVQQPGGDQIRLPEATIEKPMEEELTIQIDSDSVIIQGRKVADLNNLPDEQNKLMPELVSELVYLAERRIAQGLTEAPAVVVVADRDTPYRVIEMVMSSATEARYERMSLAVISKAIKSGGGGS